MEPQPLWEYPCTALGEPKALAHFEFSDPIQNLVKETLLPIKKQDNLDINGMALWVDWHLAGKYLQLFWYFINGFTTLKYVDEWSLQKPLSLKNRTRGESCSLDVWYG